MCNVCFVMLEVTQVLDAVQAGNQKQTSHYNVLSEPWHESSNGSSK